MTLQSFQVVKCSLSKYLFLASLHSCWRRHRVTMSRPIQLTYKVIMPGKDFFLQIWHFQLNTCLWLMTVTEAGSICICQAHYSKLRRFALHCCPQEYTRKGNGSVCRPAPSRIKDFWSQDFRDGILVNPGILGFFRTGLASYLNPGISSKRSRIPILFRPRL